MSRPYNYSRMSTQLTSECSFKGISHLILRTSLSRFTNVNYKIFLFLLVSQYQQFSMIPTSNFTYEEMEAKQTEVTPKVNKPVSRDLELQLGFCTCLIVPIASSYHPSQELESRHKHLKDSALLSPKGQVLQWESWVFGEGVPCTTLQR